MDKEKIKQALYTAKQLNHNVLGRMVVGDCPTRSFECAAELDTIVDRLFSVLHGEGVITLNEKEMERIKENVG